MRINYPRLWTFYNVAITKSGTAAARRLHLTQPAVSMHLSQLSRDLGVKLFDRIEKKMELTDDGKALFRYTEAIFNLSQQAIDEIATRSKETSMRLELAAGLLFVEHYLPQLIGEFQRKNPEAQFKIHTGPTRPLIEKLSSYECHFGFLGQVPDDEGFVVQRIAKDKIVVLVAPDHPLGRRRSVKLKVLSQYPVLTFAKGSETRTLLEEVLRKNGITIKPIMESFSSEGIKRAVEAGMGIAPFLLKPAERELREKSLVALDIERMTIPRFHNFVFKADFPLSPLAIRFKAFVNEAIKKGMWDKSKPRVTRANST